jgi:hypothetical protein
MIVQQQKGRYLSEYIEERLSRSSVAASVVSRTTSEVPATFKWIRSESANKRQRQSKVYRSKASTEFLAPLVISHPLKSCWHIQQITDQREFLGTWRERQCVEGLIMTAPEVEVKSKSEGSPACQKVVLNHLKMMSEEIVGLNLYVVSVCGNICG